MTSKKMCYAWQNSAIRHETTFVLLSVSLPQTPARLAASTHTQRTAAENNNSVLQRQQCNDLALNVTSHISYFLPLTHGNTYTPQSGRGFFASSCGLICLSQMSFQVVKVSKKVDKKGHPGVFRSQVRHLSGLGTNRMKMMSNSGQLPFPRGMRSNGIPAVPEETG